MYNNSSVFYNLRFVILIHFHLGGQALEALEQGCIIYDGFKTFMLKNK